MKNKLQVILNQIADFFKDYFTVTYLLGVPRELWISVTVASISTLLIILGAAVRFGLLRKFKEKVYRKYINHAFKWSWIFGFTGLILSFFAYEKAPGFGYRLWLYLWMVAVVVWIVMLIFKERPRMLADLKKHKVKKEKEKWLKK